MKPVPSYTPQTQRLAQLREWFRRNDRAWWAEKADAQLLNETRLDCYRSGVRELPEAISCMACQRSAATQRPSRIFRPSGSDAAFCDI